MAWSQTTQAKGTHPSSGVPIEMVTRVGMAAGRVAMIQQEYAVQAEGDIAADARLAMADKARAAAEKVLDDEGLSIEDYNAVLAAAESDRDLERCLLDAARTVLS